MGDLGAELERLVEIVLRRRWIALAVAWLVAAAGWTAGHLVPDQYAASARVYVDADQVLTPLLHGLALDNPLAAQIELLQQKLLSGPNIEKLISKTDLSLAVRSPADLERMVTRLRHQIEVVPQSNGLFTITYQNRNAQLAYDVVDTVLGIFVEDKAGSSRADMANAETFLNGQIASYEQQLRDAEGRRAAFRAKYVDLIPGDGANGATRLDQARDDLHRLSGELVDAQSRQQLLAAQLAHTAPARTVGGNAALAAGEARLQEMRVTMTDSNPDVVQQRQVVDQLRHGATGGAVAEPNIAYQQLEVMEVQTAAEAASLRRQVADASSEVTRLEAIARDVPSIQAHSMNLNRDYDVLRTNYEELLARREAMRLSDAADTQADKIKLEIVDPPQLPRVPVSPNRALLLSLALAVGLGAGVGATLLLASLDRSFREIADLRRLGVPVVGSIALVRSGSIVRRTFDVSSVLAACASLVALLAVYGALVYRSV